MIGNTTLNDLQDVELRTVIEQCEGLLKQRDEDRKAKAMDQARSLQAKPLNEARAVLEAAGLSLKSLNGSSRKRAAKRPVYHSGHTYQHPADKALVWNAKGKKPRWLVDLEAEGKAAAEVG
jgi:DNA-binding protein H-NS